MQIRGASPSDAESVSAIRYDDWRTRIQLASDIDQLVRIVREYLATWTHDQLAPLPVEVGATALCSSVDLSARAVLASQADLRWKGDQKTARLLREMALTLGAAASRLRFLTAIRATEAASIPRREPVERL